MTWWNILLNYSSHSLQQSPEASQKVSHLPVVMCTVQWGCPGLNCLQPFLDSILYMFLSHPTQPSFVSCKGYDHLMNYLCCFLAIFRPSPHTYMYLKIMFFLFYAFYSPPHSHFCALTKTSPWNCTPLHVTMLYGVCPLPNSLVS